MSDNDDLRRDALIRLHHHGAAEIRDPGVAEDTAAQALLADWAAQDAALARIFPAVEGPLPDRIQSVLDAARHPAAPRWARPRLSALAAALALFVAGGASGWYLAPRPPTDPMALLSADALRAHETYVVEVAHPVEVPASDEAHLIKWLTKRLGHPVRIPDLAAQGLHLVGGRLLPGEDRPAALFMYENDTGQRVTLYVTPEAGTEDTAFRLLEGAQNTGFWWTDGGLGCAIIGPMGRDQMRAIARTAYDQLV